MEQLALPAPVNASPVIIDSGNFVKYLITENFWDSKNFIIAPQLNLPFLVPFSKNVYGKRRLTNVLDEEARNDWKNVLENDPILASLSVAKSGEFQQSVVDKQDAAERMTLLYFDRRRNKIRRSPVVHGEYERVSLDTTRLSSLPGMYPLMVVHTHPDDSLPSEIDYTSILLKNTNNQRYFRAELVLAPTVQVLAVAHSDTKLLTRPEINAAIDANTLNAHDQSEYDDRTERYYRAWDMMDEFSDQYKAKIPQEARMYREAYLFGEISEEEYIRISTDAQNRVRKDHRDFAKQTSERIVTTLGKLEDYKGLLNNAYNLAYARQMNVSLFVSQDMENFTLFSS